MNSLVPHISGIVERCFCTGCDNLREIAKEERKASYDRVEPPFCVITALDGEIVSRHPTREEANVEAIRLATSIGGVKFEVRRRG